LVRKSLIVILCMLSSAAFAQEGSRRGLFFRPDTTFAVRHPNRFTIRPNVGTTFGMFTSQWTTEEGPHDYSLMSSPVFKAGCSVSYLGLTAGIHRDVKELFGETEETEFNISGYSSVVGGEMAYSSSYTHTMSSNAEGETLWQLPLSGCHTRRFLANAYGVLNPRRFSLPAAFTQRYKQLRSAGSALIGVSLTGFRMDVDVAQLPPQLTDANAPYDYAHHIIYVTANVGAGYAYNWVLPDNWMLHASYLHCLSLYHHGEIAFTEGTIPLGHRVNHGGIVRLGSVWDNHRYFGGFTGTMQLQWMSHTPLSIFDFYVSTQLFFGFRF
jgi:hypothetical protein